MLLKNNLQRETKMKRIYKKETIIKMANELEYNIIIDCGRVYLMKESDRIIKHGFAKAYDYLYNVRKKQVA
jgi:hypothetical protein